MLLLIQRLSLCPHFLAGPTLRLSSLEQKLDTERNVTLAALTDLESKLTRESLEREQSVQVAARAVMATQRLATNASAGSTITDLSRERGGALSPEDLSHVFHRHGVGVSSAEVAFVVTALDVDGSGSIDGTELEYLGSTAQDIINLASHVEQEVQAGMSELVARMQMEIRGASLGVRALQRLMSTFRCCCKELSFCCLSIVASRAKDLTDCCEWYGSGQREPAGSVPKSGHRRRW